MKKQDPKTIDCSKHKGKGKCIIEGCNKARHPRRPCPKCKQMRYRWHCVKGTLDGHERRKANAIKNNSNGKPTL